MSSDDELRGRTPEERRDLIRRQLGAPSDEVLREPPARELPRDAAGRLTVQELLNRMNAAGSSGRAAPSSLSRAASDGPSQPPAGEPRSSTDRSPTPPSDGPSVPPPRPRRVRPADAPTETISRAVDPGPPSDPNPRGSRTPAGGQPSPPANLPNTPSNPFARTDPPQRGDDDSQTEVIPAAKDDPPVYLSADPEPNPDSSHDSVADRVQPAVVPESGAGTARGRRHAAAPKERDRAALTRNARMGGRVLLALACVMTLLGTGAVWGYQKVKDGNWNIVDAVNPDNSEIRGKELQTGDETYLIVGTDTRSGKNGQIGAGTTEDAGGARSDTVILVNIPADRSRVVAVSFPRDLQINRPECTTWDNDKGEYTGQIVPAETGAKLNTAYGDGGPKCIVDTLTAISGLNINHFIAMDFSGFEKVVNKIGGVEVCSPVPLNDFELGPILTKPGKQKIRGKAALNYVRARTIDTEGNGDYGRIKRQQLFLSSLLRGALSSKVLSNPATLNGIVDTFIQNSFVDQVNTDDLLQLAQSMQGLDAGRVTFLTVPTSGTAEDGSGNEIPRDADIRAIFDAIINDEPLPGEKEEKPAGTTTSTTTSSTPSRPADVTVSALDPYSVSMRVLNGTGTAGVATGIAESLANQGFGVQGVADASENRTDTVVRYGEGQQVAAATVAQLFPGASIQADNTVQSGIEVIVGSEYSGNLGSPALAGSQITVAELPRESGTDELPNDLTVTNAADTTCA
ncbi:LCP family glycopolymer transferase [Williamsia muralis]|uniref:LCP family protein n=1 Tax=Williamsia marianensis TaxID=85044 RepID=UPI003F5CF3C7